MVKSVLEFFYFKILLAMSIKPFWTDFLYWAAATLKGLVELQNKKKKSRPPFTIIFNSKMLVSRPEILGVLSGVNNNF